MALLEICCYSMECALTAPAKRCGSYRTVRRAERRGAYAFAGRLTQRTRAYYDSRTSDYSSSRRDFYYTDGEFAAMLEDIRLVRELGFPGLVTGVLTVDGDVDMSRMEK
ncbi:putative copper homeostasis protein [Salmonella enterica subsp. enterica]|uniref:Copper homeostasis protein cutC homolog n=1 Tax=Salmonella enterica I TaxID=59201 RepID=A0A3S4J062_SALET|nr:putative copper homeostasis protein [Salmonella enterica subsp. enterica]